MYEQFIFLLTFVSSVFSLIIPLMYVTSPRCRQHPSLILALISIIGIIQCYHFTLMFYDWRKFDEQPIVNYLSSNIILPSNKLCNGYYDYSQGNVNVNVNDFYICHRNKLIFSCSISLEFLLNNLLTIDFIFILKYPLMSNKSRLIRQSRFIFLLSIPDIIINIIQYIQYDESYWYSSNNLDDWGYIGQLLGNYIDNIQNFRLISFLEIPFYINLIIAIYIGIKSLGISKQIVSEKIYIQKKQLIKRYLYYQIVLGLISLIPFTFGLIVFYGGYVIEIFQDNIDLTAQILTLPTLFVYMTQGIVLGGLRMKEIYFRKRFIYLIKSKFCFKLSQNEMNEIEQIDQIDDQNNLNLTLQQLLANIQSYQAVSCTIKSIEQLFLEQSIINIQNCDQDQYQGDINVQLQIYSGSFHYKEINQPLLDEYESVVKLTLHHPKIFVLLMKQFGKDPKQFRKSFSFERNKEQILKTKESLGKSGSFFFHTWDQKYIIKTLFPHELQLLKNGFYQAYSQHTKQNELSLLCKIFGIFTVKIESMREMHLILMENILDINKHGFPNKLYDLKGSLVNRYQIINQEDIDNQQPHIPKTLKDQNLLDEWNPFLQLDPYDHNKLMNQIQIDSEFLSIHNIMDYSLLLGLYHENNQSIESNYNFQWGIVDGQQYNIGIIDYLQQYNYAKQFETCLKSYKNGNGMISSVRPQQYKIRFQNFFNQIFIVEN